MPSGAPPELNAWRSDAFAACNVGLCVLDRELRVVCVNESLLALLNCAEDPVGQFFWKALLGLAEPSKRCPASATLADGLAHRSEIGHIVSQAKRSIAYVTNAIRGADGEIVGAVVAFEDVTESQELAQAAAEAEAQYFTLLDHLPDMAVLAEPDTGNIIHANRHACALAGRSRDELLRSGIESLWPEATRNRVMLEMDRALERGYGTIRDAELLDAGGESIPVEVAVAQVAYLGGSAIQALVRDVSETVRQRRENAARRKRLSAIEEITRELSMELDRDRLETSIIDAMPALIEADLYALYVSENHHHTLAYRAHQAISPATQARLEVIVARTVGEFSEEGIAYENVVRTPRHTVVTDAGADLATESYLNIPITVAGRMMGLLTVTATRRDAFGLDDLSILTTLSNEAAMALDRMQYCRRSLQSERMAAVGETVATIAHYATNLTSNLRSSSHMMDSAIERQDWERVDRSWTIARRGIQSVSRLVMNLLNYSKEREPIPEPTDLRELMEIIAEQWQPRADQSGVTIVLDLEALDRDVLLDPEQLEHCLVNLVSNGLQAMAEGGTLSLIARTTSDGPDGAGQLVLEVADTGNGIPEADLAKIFEPFYSSKGSRGTGIGLAVSKKIAREHGGDLTVTTELGKGTTFRITLPVNGGDSVP